MRCYFGYQIAVIVFFWRIILSAHLGARFLVKLPGANHHFSHSLSLYGALYDAGRIILRIAATGLLGLFRRLLFHHACIKAGCTNCTS